MVYLIEAAAAADLNSSFLSLVLSKCIFFFLCSCMNTIISALPKIKFLSARTTTSYEYYEIPHFLFNPNYSSRTRLHDHTYYRREKIQKKISLQNIHVQARERYDDDDDEQQLLRDAIIITHTCSTRFVHASNVEMQNCLALRKKRRGRLSQAFGFGEFE